jgi:hypothetical protein
MRRVRETEQRKVTDVTMVAFGVIGHRVLAAESVHAHQALTGTTDRNRYGDLERTVAVDPMFCGFAFASRSLLNADGQRLAVVAAIGDFICAIVSRADRHKPHLIAASGAAKSSVHCTPGFLEHVCHRFHGFLVGAKLQRLEVMDFASRLAFDLGVVCSHTPIVGKWQC